jgi:hypothetical protein
MTLKNTVFRDMISCSPMEVYRCFGGTYCLHLRGLRLNQETHKGAAITLLASSMLLALLCDPEDGEICSSETYIKFYQITRSEI